jgi:outer membrane protein TolC
MRQSGLFLLAAVMTVPVAAQVGGSSPPPSANVTQLPLSGRTAQSGSVNSVQTPIPGVTSSVNTLNTSVQVQGPYTGSLPQGPFTGKLTLAEAVRRGLQYNLGTTGLGMALRQAQGQARTARSALMPNLNGNLKESVLQNDLAVLGVKAPVIPGVGKLIPSITPPFNYFDLRATLTQNIADFTALNNYRSSKEIVKADQQYAQDARDLVVLGVGGAYLQVMAAEARLGSARAQLDTATALFKQTDERRQAGLNAQIDSNRSRVQMQTQQQRLTSLENDLAKQRINLARMTGLPLGQKIEIAGTMSYAPAPAVTAEEALKQASERRGDLKAAEAEVRAAERTLAAAKAERYPTLGLSADYGVIGTNPAQSHGTFTVTGQLRFPIWQGGKAEGDIAQAQASLDQRRAELADLKGRIEGDIRSALLDLDATSGQVDVAKSNEEVSRQTLVLTRQRFEMGVTDSVEVVQAQEGVATAELDYINSVFAHNVAKLTLARALGHAEEILAQYLP